MSEQFETHLFFEMAEQQDLQSLLYFLFNSSTDTLSFEEKAIFEVLRSWSQRFIYFADKARISLTDEEVEEEKQLFFNEIGLDEKTFNNMFWNALPIPDEQGTESSFFKALGKCVREKIQKSISPSA